MDTAFDLQTWQQAFEQHPISTTRTIEKQLRVNAANNREKLRILVGGNYRELLSTAEQIVALDGRLKTTESHISGIGQQCKPPPQQTRTNPRETHRQILAKLRLLQRCIAAAHSALGNDNFLQSAQMIVIARLLVKSLTDDEEFLKPLSALRNEVASLRRRLLRRVDVSLTNPRSTPTTVTNASCAYCLLTSAAFQDVFRHIARLRLERLRKHMEQPLLMNQHANEGLRYYIKTMKLLGGLTRRSMIDALADLQRRPILADPTIIGIELLDLKGIGAPIPEEVRGFIPYFKRTPFSAAEVREALLTWSSDAAPVFAKGLEQLLLDKLELVHVLDLRKTLFAILLPIYFSLPGSSAMSLVLHRVFSERIDSLTKVHVDQLQGYYNQLLSSVSPDNSSPSLWQEDSAMMPLNNGAANFLGQVHLRRGGISRPLDMTTRSINMWLISTKRILDAFQELPKIRWRDMLEEPDVEQENEVNQVLGRLGKDDPEHYCTRMNKALKNGFERLEHELVTRVTGSIEDRSNAKLAVHHLRTIRELVIPLRQAFPGAAGFQELDGLIPRIHRIIATEVLSQVSMSPEGEGDVNTRQNNHTIENLPSPRTFDFLRRLCAAMFEVGGTDVWSPTAVKVLKTVVAEKVFADQGREAYVGSVFDAEYLAVALDHAASKSGEATEEKEAAQYYWTRTKLLFGVLLSV